MKGSLFYDHTFFIIIVLYQAYRVGKFEKRLEVVESQLEQYEKQADVTKLDTVTADNIEKNV